MICRTLLIVGSVTGSSTGTAAVVAGCSTGAGVVATSSGTGGALVATSSSSGGAFVATSSSAGGAVLPTSFSTRIAVLDLLRRDPDLTEESVFQRIFISDPTVDFDDVVRTVDEVNFYSRVPSYFHAILQNYVSRGGIRSDDPEVLEAIIANRPRTTEKQFLQNAIKHWIELCIYPSIHFPGACCNIDPADPSFWRLTLTRKISLIESLIYQSISPTSDATVAAERLYRGDINLTPSVVAVHSGITVAAATEIRKSLIRIFTQPHWFLDLLLTTQYGPIDPENTVLIQAIKVAGTQRRVGVNGDLSMAIRAWKKLVIDPIRRREVNPLPYSRFYPTVSGETVELVVIRASLVQKYLRNEIH